MEQNQIDFRYTHFLCSPKTLTYCVIFSVFWALVGCQPTPQTSLRAPDASATSLDMDGGTCIGDQCGGGAVQNLSCSAKKVAARGVARVMILLDKSDSMHNCLDLNGGVPIDDKLCPSGHQRWEAARDELAKFLPTTANKIHWGMTIFPSSCSPGACGSPSAPEKSISDVGGADIVAWMKQFTRTQNSDGSTPNPLNPYGCKGPTNTGSALNWASTQVSTWNADAVFLVTDGGESSECVVNGNWTNASGATSSCSGGPSSGAAVCGTQGASAIRAKHVSTYVLGLATGAGTNARLTETAAEGGTTLMTANSGADLAKSFESIAGSVTPCLYDFSKEADVSFDGQMKVEFVPKDASGAAMQVTEGATSGYTVDKAMKSITFNGAACDAVKSGTYKEVNVSYSCKVVPI